jgi:uncharacterized protein YdeI (YjbR/CyaY-like superfamily)
LEEDSEPREVQLPPDLSEALDGSPAAKAFFEQLSYTHQKEYVQWIEEAKREETRQRRVQGTVDLLLKGEREH